MKSIYISFKSVKLCPENISLKTFTLWRAMYTSILGPNSYWSSRQLFNILLKKKFKTILVYSILEYEWSKLFFFKMCSGLPLSKVVLHTIRGDQTISKLQIVFCWSQMQNLCEWCGNPFVNNFHSSMVTFEWDLTLPDRHKK